jgi:CHAD domain-containing protein
MDQQYELWQPAGPARRRSRGEPVTGAPQRRRPRRGAPAAPLVTDLADKGLTKKAGTTAVKAKLGLIPADATADEAFRQTLQHCKWHILANVGAVQENRDVEGVHQMRVALRRLRVALAAFGKEFRTPAVEALRMRAKILAQGLAPARDMDVFLGELFEPAAEANGSVEAFGVLRERAQAAQRAGWDNAVREVSGLAFHTFLHDFGDAIDQRLWYAPDNAEALAVFEAPARALADRMLSKRLKGAKKRARNLEELSEPERHKLRIALKKMRYASEFFGSLYPEEDVKPFQKRLSKMQDILGLLQDVAVARNTLKHLVEEPPDSLFTKRADLAFAAGIVYGWHLDRASSAWTDAMRCWKRFAKAEPFWKN